MNRKHAIIWDTKNVHAIRFNGKFQETKVLKNNKNGREIHDVRVGTNPSYCAIVISNHHDDSILLWDLKKNCEKDMIDIEGKYEIMFDENGNFNVIQKN